MFLLALADLNTNTISQYCQSCPETLTRYSRVHSTCCCWNCLLVNPSSVSATQTRTTSESTTPFVAWHCGQNIHARTHRLVSSDMSVLISRLLTCWQWSIYTWCTVQYNFSKLPYSSTSCYAQSSSDKHRNPLWCLLNSVLNVFLLQVI